MSSKYVLIGENETGKEQIGKKKVEEFSTYYLWLLWIKSLRTIFYSYKNNKKKGQMARQKSINTKNFIFVNISSLLTIVTNPNKKTSSADLEVQLVQLNHCDGEYSNY